MTRIYELIGSYESEDGMEIDYFTFNRYRTMEEVEKGIEKFKAKFPNYKCFFRPLIIK